MARRTVRLDGTHWGFASQWDRFWQPAIDEAILVAAGMAPRDRGRLSVRRRNASSARASDQNVIYVGAMVEAEGACP